MMGAKSASRSDEMSPPPSPFAGRRDGGQRAKRVVGAVVGDLAFGLKIALVLFALGAGWSFGIRYFGFKSDYAAVQHLVSAIGCDASMMVGVASAREGQPGYWGHLDVDQDTVACEPNDPAITGRR